MDAQSKRALSKTGEAADKEWNLNFQLLRLDEAIVSMNEAIARYRSLSQSIGETCGIDLRYHNVGAIECKGALNPVGRCVYHYGDLAHDHCRYCDLPEERK